MKAKTKFEHKVNALSQKLQPISLKQDNWAWANCFENIAFVTKEKANCLECGHSWATNKSVYLSKKCSCPQCGKKLNITVTRQKSLNVVKYCAILTTVDNIQVVRMMYVTKDFKVGRKAIFTSREVMQHWIEESGDSCFLSRSVNGFSMYYDSWCMGTALELKNVSSSNAQLRMGTRPFKIYPQKKILEAITRNGFKGNYYGFSPAGFFKEILNNSAMETLLKANQIEMMKYLFGRRNVFTKYWSSVKICLRNGYIIKDPSLWCDYIDLLKYFKKDTLNSLYVCPKDLNNAHDKLVKKKREIQKKQDIEEHKLRIETAEIQKEQDIIKRRLTIETAEIRYKEEKEAFFGLIFNDGELNLKVMETVKAFAQEGDELSHCIFTNQYYEREDSLLFSARIGEELVETVEVSLSELKVLQARGYENKPTVHHDKIVNLMESNMKSIRKRIKSNHLACA